jgi:hypothetical protein
MANKFSFEIEGNLKYIAPSPHFSLVKAFPNLDGKGNKDLQAHKSHFPILWKGKKDLLAKKTLFGHGKISLILRL